MADNRLYHWWRTYHYLDDSDAWAGRTIWNIQMVGNPIRPGFTLERIVGYHRAYIVPKSGDPNVSGAILGIPNHAVLVYDDGSDPNLAGANLEYVLEHASNEVLWSKTWCWGNLFGFDYIGGLAPGVLDDHADPNFDMHARRKRDSAASTPAYLRFVAQAHWAIGHELPRAFLNHLGLNTLVSVPNT